MTRRGVHRWAARAFCPGVKVNVLRSPSGRCCVELWLPTTAGHAGGGVVRWAEGASWGECVRTFEEYYLFAEAPRAEWCFQSQLVVHERRDEVTLRVLGGAGPPRTVKTMLQELAEIGLPIKK